MKDKDKMFLGGLFLVLVAIYLMTNKKEEDKPQVIEIKGRTFKEVN